jgi:hypothetical protein
MSVMGSRVENRRSNFSLPVDSRLGFRLITAVRFGLVLFPVAFPQVPFPVRNSFHFLK